MKFIATLLTLCLLASNLLAQNTSGKFYVIVGAYSSEKSAKLESKRYKKRGFKKSKVLVSPNKKVYRVSVAEYSSYDKASTAITRLVRKRTIPMDAWTTDNSKLAGYELGSDKLNSRRLEMIERLLKNGGVGNLSNADIKDIDQRISTIETIVNTMSEKLERMEVDFNTVKEDHNALILGEGGGSIRARDAELAEMKKMINELRSGNFQIEEAPVVEKVLEPEVKEPEVVMPLIPIDTAKPVVKDTVVAPVPVKKEEKKPAEEPKKEEEKPAPKMVKKTLDDFNFKQEDTKAGLEDAYNLIYVGYNNSLSEKNAHLKYANIDESAINNEGKSENFIEARDYFLKYAKYDGAKVATLEEPFKIKRSAKRNGVNFGVSRGFLKGYIYGRIDKIVKNSKIQNYEQFLDKTPIEVDVPEAIGELKLKDKENYKKAFEVGFRDAFVYGYESGYNNAL